MTEPIDHEAQIAHLCDLLAENYRLTQRGKEFPPDFAMEIPLQSLEAHREQLKRELLALLTIDASKEPS